MSEATPVDGSSPDAALISLRDLRVTYRSSEADIPAVRGVSLDLHPGEVLALVGESASGKSTVGHAILGLLPANAEVAGEVRYRGRALDQMASEELEHIRGREIAVIFQDALAALTPTLTIGQQLREPFTAHLGMAAPEADAAARAVLREVLPDADRVMDAYPFQVSGGMAQRVMVAMATALKPKVVIADEPTANLDTAVRHETLERLEGLRDAGSAVLIITHDFGVVARIADRVAVMYAGRLAEESDVRTTFRAPKHPYTFGLLQSLPSMSGRGRLVPMRGNPPDLATLGPECPFLPRCNKAVSQCRIEAAPELEQVPDSAPGHRVACYNPMAVPLRD